MVKFRKKKEKLTAEEIVNRLENDPEYQKEMAEIEKKRNVEIELSAIAFRKVQEDLEKINVKADSIRDLIKKHAPFSNDIVVILIKWIPVIERVNIQDGLIRALCVTKLPFDGKILVELFEKDSPDADRIRWSICNTIAFGQVSGINDWIIKTIQNNTYGQSREMLCYALIKLFSEEKSIEILKTVFDDLAPQPVYALAKFGKSKSLIEYLRHKQDEYINVQKNNNLSKDRKERIKATIKVIDDAVKKIEKRMKRKIKLSK